MRRVAYTFFVRYDPIRKREIRSRHRLPVDQLPPGAKAVGEVEWREIPETAEEKTAATFRR
jgi:hypothetical protein